jgi:hypothetical protein
MPRHTVKKLLLSLMAVGVLASVTTKATYAVFQSEGKNAGSIAGSGTLTLSDQVGAGTTCITETASSNDNFNTGCAAIFTPVDPYNYPGTFVTVHVTIKNTGSVNGKALYVWMPPVQESPSLITGCTVTTTVSNAVDPNPGGGNPCTGDELFIQEETDGTFSSAKECWYPGPTTGACATPTTGTPNDFGTNYYDYVGHKLMLETLGTDGRLQPLSGIAAGSSRYFVIGMAIPSGASNTLQDEAANFPLRWHLESFNSIS